MRRAATTHVGNDAARDALLGCHASVVHMLADTAKRYPARSALVCGDTQLNYQQFATSAARFARHLKELGAEGERVALVLGNSIDIAIAYYAAFAAGAQVVPVNPMYQARELAQILEDAAPRVVLFDTATAERVEPLAERLSIPHLFQFTGETLAKMDGPDDVSLDDFHPAPDELAVLQYTGGTTGLPKGVNITHRQLAINIAQREALLPTISDNADAEHILCVMPLFHVYAASMAMNLAINCAGTMVIAKRYHPQEVLDTLTRERITLFPGSPTLYTGLMGHPHFAATDFSALRLCYSGAERLPEHTLGQWEAATGCTVLEGFGQSEAGPVLSFNPEHGVKKPASVGVPVPQTDIEIVDVETGSTVLGVDEPGEIRVRGPQIMSGYRNRADETTAALRDGWLYTGDLGRIDGDGYLFIVGRKKEMIVVGGYNVYPREIEDVLYACTGVVDAAVVGVPDPAKGEAVHAFVVLTGQTDEAEITRHCEADLAKYKRPSTVHILDELPRTAVGKVDKIALEAAASRGSA